MRCYPCCSEVIAVNQDKLGKMGRRVQVSHLIQLNFNMIIAFDFTEKSRGINFSS